MNKKGFTLIELIATIALLAIIALISFVSINKILDTSKISDCETLVNNIKTSAKEYASDNRYSKDTNIEQFNASILTTNNYLTAPIINPFTKEEINPDSIKINVTLNPNYTVKSVDITNNGNIINCSNKKW